MNYFKHIILKYIKHNKQEIPKINLLIGFLLPLAVGAIFFIPIYFFNWAGTASNFVFAMFNGLPYLTNVRTFSSYPQYHATILLLLIVLFPILTAYWYAVIPNDLESNLPNSKPSTLIIFVIGTIILCFFGLHWLFMEQDLDLNRREMIVYYAYTYPVVYYLWFITAFNLTCFFLAGFLKLLVTVDWKIK